MNKTVRTTLSLFLGMALLSAVALAGVNGTAAKKDNKDQKEHHSRLAKAAFWRHQKNEKNSVKPQARQSQSKKATVDAAKSKPKPVKQASSKHVHKNAEQVSKLRKSPAKKSQAHKVASAHKVAKTAPKQHAANTRKPVKQHTTAKKSKPQEKAQTRTTASLNK